MDDFTFDTDLFAEINDSQAEIFDVIEDEKFDVEQYINGDTDYWHKPVGCPTTCPIGTSNLKILFRSSVSPWTTKSLRVCHHTGMNKTQLFSDSNLQELQDFMFDTMASAEMAVDWFCDRFSVNADDDVIDFVLDAHDAFFGNW